MKRKSLFMLVALFLLIGCGGVQFPDSPRGDYAAALTFFNDTVEAYTKVLAVQPAATKAKWKADINPQIKLAGEALALWGGAVGSDQDGPKEIVYLRLLQQLIISLVNSGIITTGG